MIEKTTRIKVGLIAIASALFIYAYLYPAEYSWARHHDEIARQVESVILRDPHFRNLGVAGNYYGIQLNGEIESEASIQELKDALARSRCAASVHGIIRVLGESHTREFFWLPGPM